MSSEEAERVTRITQEAAWMNSETVVKRIAETMPQTTPAEALEFLRHVFGMGYASGVTAGAEYVRDTVRTHLVETRGEQ